MLREKYGAAVEQLDEETDNCIKLAGDIPTVIPEDAISQVVTCWLVIIRFSCLHFDLLNFLNFLCEFSFFVFALL